MTDDGFLAGEATPAFHAYNPNAAGPFLLVCEHASNRIPAVLGNLGLDDAVLSSHAAWDLGAIGVARGLADHLDATLISAGYSRLVYDLNRPPSSSEAIRAQSEVHRVPGNVDLSDDERQARIDSLYRPFHRALATTIGARRERGQETVLVAIHTFTPVYFGRPRPVELGILHDRDDRFAEAMLQAAARLTRLNTARNQPYGPEDGVAHMLAEHAIPNGLLNVMIEIRNDLVADADDQRTMSRLLADMVEDARGALAMPAAATSRGRG